MGAGGPQWPANAPPMPRPFEPNGGFPRGGEAEELLPPRSLKTIESPAGPGPSVESDLDRELSQLREERESLGTLRQQTNAASSFVENVDLASLFQQGQVLRDLLRRLATGGLNRSRSGPELLGPRRNVSASEDPTGEARASSPSSDDEEAMTVLGVLPLTSNAVKAWWKTVSRRLGLSEESRSLIAASSADQTSAGKAYFRAGEYGKALAAFRQIPLEQQEPQDGFYVQYMIATCLRKLGSLDESRRIYSKLAESSDNGILAKYADWQLRLLQRQKELEGRTEELGQLGPAVGPSPAVDQMAVGKAYFRAADYEQALAAFQRIPLEQQELQDGLLVRYMIATCLRNQGKLDEAMRLYSELVNAKLKGDETVAKYASWQLQLMQWQKDLGVRAAELKMEQPTSAPGPPVPP